MVLLMCLVARTYTLYIGGPLMKGTNAQLEEKFVALIL